MMKELYSIGGSFGENGDKIEFCGSLDECREWLRERLSLVNSGFLCKGVIDKGLGSVMDKVEWFFYRRYRGYKDKEGYLVWECWNREIKINFDED